MKFRQDLWLWACAAGLTLVGIVGAWLPIARRGQAIEQSIASLESELAKPADTPERINRLRAQVERLEARGRGRTATIPKSSEVASLVQGISVSLDELGLSRREITTGSPRAVDETQSLPVTIMVSGEFQALVSLLREIEQFPRLVRVDRLKFGQPTRSKSDTPPDGALRADLVLNAFYLGEQPDAQTDASKQEGAP